MVKIMVVGFIESAFLAEAGLRPLAEVSEVSKSRVCGEGAF
jgi:hypothetical protein